MYTCSVFAFTKHVCINIYACFLEKPHMLGVSHLPSRVIAILDIPFSLEYLEELCAVEKYIFDYSFAMVLRSL